MATAAVGPGHTVDMTALEDFSNAKPKDFTVIKRCAIVMMFPAVIVALLAVSVRSSHAGFGAIAFSSSDGALGYSERYPSQQSAEIQAVIECHQRGGSDCRIATWERNACAVLAVGKGNGWGATWHPNAYVAERRAIAKCGDSAPECEAKAWICN
jgi:hypothetical protein